MEIITKRNLLFLLGCMSVRILLVCLAKYLPPKYLKYMGYAALLPAIGFLVIFFTNSRKTGPEVFGEKIWWNRLRPVHGILYLIFAYMAINMHSMSYIPLLIDVLVGFSAFLMFRLSMPQLNTAL